MFSNIQDMIFKFVKGLLKDLKVLNFMPDLPAGFLIP